MTINEYLQKVEYYRWRIESKKEKLLALETLATNTTASYSGMPHNPSASPSRTTDAVVKKIDIEASIKQDEEEIEKLRYEMQLAIDQVKTPKYQTVLYKRYIRNLSIVDIADEINYSVRTTERMLHEANKILAAVLQ